jgi:hypothetical protein
MSFYFLFIFITKLADNFMLFKDNIDLHIHIFMQLSYFMITYARNVFKYEVAQINEGKVKCYLFVNQQNKIFHLHFF